MIGKVVTNDYNLNRLAGLGGVDDGTMVVIEQGKRHVGQVLDVVVTSVLQTPAVGHDA